MKLIDTLTSSQLIDLYSGNVQGIFRYLINPNDTFYSENYGLCLGYYTERSYSKTISPTYERIIGFFGEHSGIVSSPEELIASIIRNKFIYKWSRTYELLVIQQYDALMDYDGYTEITKSNRGTNTYNNTITDDGNIGTDISTTSDYNDNGKLYGFNSTNPVNVDSNNGVRTERVNGDKNYNTTHNTQTRSGTSIDDFSNNDSRKTKGRDTNAAELINKELNMRDRRIFYDIVYSDIDSIVTLSIYG